MIYGIFRTNTGADDKLLGIINRMDDGCVLDVYITHTPSIFIDEFIAQARCSHSGNIEFYVFNSDEVITIDIEHFVHCLNNATVDIFNYVQLSEYRNQDKENDLQ